MPVTQRAIDPSRQGDRGNKSRGNGDKSKGGGRAAATVAVPSIFGFKPFITLNPCL